MILAETTAGDCVMSRFTTVVLATVIAGGILTMGVSCTSATVDSADTGSTGIGSASTQTADGVTRVYPLHTNVVATTFWVGEIFDPQASDGSQASPRTTPNGWPTTAAVTASS